MITVEEMPSVSRRPDAGRARRTGVVSRGTRVYLRTLRPEDLDYLSVWAEDPFLERMVGSEFLNTYKHVYDKDPSFYEACLMDSTQIVLVIEASPEWAAPLGLARLFNIHLLEGYAFLEVMLTDAKAIRRGFGVEAGKLISYYGVDVLGLRRIEAKVYEYNRLSANSLRRNGFRQEGILRKAGYQDGQCWDMLVFGILEHDATPDLAGRRVHARDRLQRHQPERLAIVHERREVDVLGMGARDRPAVHAVLRLLQLLSDLRASAPNPDLQGRRVELPAQPRDPDPPGH